MSDVKWVVDIWRYQRERGKKVKCVWLVVDAQTGEITNGAVHKEAARRLLVNQHKQAYLVRMMAPLLEVKERMI